MTDRQAAPRPQAPQPRRHRRDRARPPPVACCAPSGCATRTSASRRSASRRAGTRSPPATCRCSASASRPRRACTGAGGFPMEFGTISVSDGISMGHIGMHYSLVSREIIADSVETVVQAERLDGTVLLAGCDKSLPGHADGGRAAGPRRRLRLRGLDPARPRRRPGGQHRRRVRGCRRVLPRADHQAEVEAIERAICPGEGACGGMYTANTMAGAAEALGMALPGSAAPPAVDRRRDGIARASGEAVVGMIEKGITARTDPDQAGVRERDRRRHGVRRLHQRGAAPARDRVGGGRRRWSSTTSPASATASRTWPTSSRSGGT